MADDYQPVDPNPPSPLTESEISSTSMTFILVTGAMTIWAMRICFSTLNSFFPWLINITFTSPYILHQWYRGYLVRLSRVLVPVRFLDELVLQFRVAIQDLFR